MPEISTVPTEVKQAISLDNVVNLDTSDCDNHSDGAANKVFTSTDETKLGNALVPPINKDVATSTYTMLVADEDNRVRFTGGTSQELTLIEFSAKDKVVYFRQAGNASPTLGTLPTGMTVNGSANFTALTQHQDGAFVCVDATASAQVIDFI